MKTSLFTLCGRSSWPDGHPRPCEGAGPDTQRRLCLLHCSCHCWWVGFSTPAICVTSLSFLPILSSGSLLSFPNILIHSYSCVSLSSLPPSLPFSSSLPPSLLHVVVYSPNSLIPPLHPSFFSPPPLRSSLLSCWQDYGERKIGHVTCRGCGMQFAYRVMWPGGPHPLLQLLHLLCHYSYPNALPPSYILTLWQCVFVHFLITFALTFFHISP